MKCNDIQAQMDDCFDEGLDWPSAVERHVATCAQCHAYQTTLEGLDAALRDAPRVVPDPILTARIQASIASRPVYSGVPWAQAMGVAAAVAVLAVAGWFVDTQRMVQHLTAAKWVPVAPLFPEANWIGANLTELPGAAGASLVAASGWLSGVWGQGTLALAEITGGDSIWLWAVFLACLVLAVALNGREIASRVGHQSRASNG